MKGLEEQLGTPLPPGVRGEDINETFGNLPSFVDSGEHLLATVDSQSASVRRLVANTGTFFNAISARRASSRV